MSSAQELAFSQSIVDWDPAIKERQRRGYRSSLGEGEVLYCVESWTTHPAKDGADMFVITALRREELGRNHRVANVGEKCLDKEGKSLPMIHTHSDGNCQFSPADLVVIAARGAPFDGVQCGERHFIWEYAWRVIAISTAVERQRLARSTPP